MQNGIFGSSINDENRFNYDVCTSIVPALLTHRTDGWFLLFLGCVHFGW